MREKFEPTKANLELFQNTTYEKLKKKHRKPPVDPAQLYLKILK